VLLDVLLGERALPVALHVWLPINRTRRIEAFHLRKSAFVEFDRIERAPAGAWRWNTLGERTIRGSGQDEHRCRAGRD